MSGSLREVRGVFIMGSNVTADSKKLGKQNDEKTAKKMENIIDQNWEENRISNTVPPDAKLGTSKSAISPVIPRDTAEEKKTNTFSDFDAKKGVQSQDDKKVPQTLSEQYLDDIRNNFKKSRLLVDYLSVSITPEVSVSGWKFLDENEASRIVPNEIDTNPEFVEMKRKFGETKTYKKYKNVELYLPERFLTYFFDTFSFLGVRKESGSYVYEETGAGLGYNTGRRYRLFDYSDDRVTQAHLGYIGVFYFDPDAEDVLPDEAYASRSPYAGNNAEANYVRQRVRFELSGNALQALRAHGVFMDFILGLYKFFGDISVSRFDATIDMFNYGFRPIYFANIEKKGRMISRSKLNVMGANENPTIYIGEMHKSRTLMMYDKAAENKDKRESDEPELLEAVKANNKNVWLRCEQTFSGKEKQATQAWAFLVGRLWDMNLERSEASRIFYENLAQFMRLEFSEKCRFLKSKKAEGHGAHNERIKTDKNWQAILDAICDTPANFTFMRPDLTLEEKMFNFVYRGLGGNNFLLEVRRALGASGLSRLLIDKQEHIEKMYQENYDDDEEHDRLKVKYNLASKRIKNFDMTLNDVNNDEQKRSLRGDDDLPF